MLNYLQNILKIKDCNFVGLKGLNPFISLDNKDSGNTNSDTNIHGDDINKQLDNGIKHTNDKGETVEINLETIDKLSSSQD